MFDGMPPGATSKKVAPPASGGIEDIPDGVLEHILGFLQADEAVRTCVLARRWRHLWKSATGLRVGPKTWDVGELREFVDHLLLLRGGSPLDTCELTLGLGDFAGPNDVPRVNLWVRHAVMCKVRALRLHILANDLEGEPWLQLDDLPLVSQHLTRLELDGVEAGSSFLNFSSCPALEYLQVDNSILSLAQKISSESLKHLLIYDSEFCSDSRSHIYAPNLVSLHLENLRGKTPVLGSMPSLLEAFVEINVDCRDYCTGANYGTCDCGSCYCSDNMAISSSNCILLKGLSEAKDLALISESQMFVFKRDLRWCPTFSKLKSLLLNDYWCLLDDFDPLACILEHSLVLENLTLQLFSEGPKHNMVMKGRRGPTEMLAVMSKNLKIVSFKCDVIDKRILKVLKFMNTLNIRKSTNRELVLLKMKKNTSITCHPFLCLQFSLESSEGNCKFLGKMVTCV